MYQKHLQQVIYQRNALFDKRKIKYLSQLTPHSLHSKHNSRFIKTGFPSVQLRTVLIRQHIRWLNSFEKYSKNI
jgi:hypothetical protein